MGLFNPCLWHKSNLSIYLLNKYLDLESSQFKSNHLANYAKKILLKYDPNESSLFECLLGVLNNLNSINLSSLSLHPILVGLYEEESELDTYYDGYLDYSKLRIQNQSLFSSLKRISTNVKCLEHLSLGLMDDLTENKANLVDLLNCLIRKHLFCLKSLHIATSRNTSSLSLLTSVNCPSNNQEEQKEQEKSNFYQLSNYLLQFVNLTYLSIDYEHLSDDFLRSTVCLLSLKK